jgi:hypothetical protein
MEKTHAPLVWKNSPHGKKSSMRIKIGGRPAALQLLILEFGASEDNFL